MACRICGQEFLTGSSPDPDYCFLCYQRRRKLPKTTDTSQPLSKPHAGVIMFGSQHSCNINLGETTSRGSRKSVIIFSGGSRGAVRAIMDIARIYNCWNFGMGRPPWNDFTPWAIMIDNTNFPRFVDNLDQHQGMQLVAENIRREWQKYIDGQGPRNF